jgi:hypothetical protein
LATAVLSTSHWLVPVVLPAGTLLFTEAILFHWVETKRGMDLKKPGSQADGSFFGITEEFVPKENGYPGGWADRGTEQAEHAGISAGSCWRMTGGWGGHAEGDGNAGACRAQLPSGQLWFGESGTVAFVVHA